MKPEEADTVLWKHEYTASVNQLYYERLIARWTSRETWLRIASASSLFLGITFGTLGVTVEKPWVMWGGFVVGTVSALFTLLFDIFSVSATRRHNEEMRSRWTSFHGECEKLHFRLASSSAQQIDHISVKDMERIIELKAGIDQDEQPCDEELIRVCQREINKRTYAVSEGTYEEVLQKQATVAE